MPAPGVSGKELKSVTFYTARDRKLRLDVLPFLVAYALAITWALRSSFFGPGCVAKLTNKHAHKPCPVRTHLASAHRLSIWWKPTFGVLFASQALVRLFAYWSVDIRSRLAYKRVNWQQATHCKVLSAHANTIPLFDIMTDFKPDLCILQVVPGTITGKKDIVDIQHRILVSAYAETC